MTVTSTYRKVLVRANYAHAWRGFCLVIFIIFAACYVLSIWGDKFIGHADAANNAVVARSIARGNGFSINYMAQFYREYPSIIHPEDNWPLLQPIIMAASYRALGDNVFAAKLPNLLMFIGLTALVYVIAAELYGVNWGLLAALLLFIDRRLVEEIVLFPLNDVGSAFFLTLGIYAVARGYRAMRRQYLWIVLGGLCTGLAFLQKPSVGGILLPSIVCIMCLRKPTQVATSKPASGPTGFWQRINRRAALIAIIIAATILLAAPYAYRNAVAFGKLFYTAESYHAFILKYRPWEDIYRIYTNHLPSWSTLSAYGMAKIARDDAAQVIAFFRDLLHGALLPSILLFPLAWGLVHKKRQPAQMCFEILIVDFCLTSLMLVFYWHYELRYMDVYLPFAYIFAVYGLKLIWDGQRLLGPLPQLTARITAVGLAVCLMYGPLGSLRALAYVRGPSDSAVPAKLQPYTWLAHNTESGAVVMTRNPWELNYHTERLAVQIPNESIDVIEKTQDKYNATFLVLGPAERDTRPQLAPLWLQLPTERYQQVFRDVDTGTLVLKINRQARN